MTIGSTLSQKVTARHLQRQAMLYVRQSTLHQVLENTESTARQYALRERAIALGWPTERVVVIDQDLGQSGASAVDREGFQRLVAEVGLGHVGLVMGLEVSFWMKMVSTILQPLMIGCSWECMLDIIWNAVEDEYLTVIMYLLCSIPMRFSGNTSQMIHNKRNDVGGRAPYFAG